MILQSKNKTYKWTCHSNYPILWQTKAISVSSCHHSWSKVSHQVV